MTFSSLPLAARLCPALRHFLLAAGLFICCGWGQVARAQHFDQLTRPVASIYDEPLIDMVLGELLILPPDTATVTRIDVVDLTANGYGPDDVLLLYPSMAAYLLRGDVPARVQQVMKRWELEADYRLDASLEESARVEAEAHRQQSAQDALSGAVIAALNRYYHADEIDLRLSRDTAGLRLEMWNFNPEAMQYVPPPSGPECAPAMPPAPRLATLPQEQQFRFRQPRFILAFQDPGECLVTVLSGSKMQTRPCLP